LKAGARDNPRNRSIGDWVDDSNKIRNGKTKERFPRSVDVRKRQRGEGDSNILRGRRLAGSRKAWKPERCSGRIHQGDGRARCYFRI